MVVFNEKFTGAKAAVFAELCWSYVQEVRENCHDTPEDVPLFSWLSPFQRLHLVRQVMVGLLCEDEPFPPTTIQHCATYYALISVLRTYLEVETDMQDDFSIGDDDLVVDDQDLNSNAPAQTPERQPRSQEEVNERMANYELIRDRAEKNKRKLDRKCNETLPDYDESAVIRKNSLERIRLAMYQVTILFDGPPLSYQQRQAVRKPTTENEKWAFRWRLLCDAAFQEHKQPLLSLSGVSFDFRSRDYEKWVAGIDTLFFATTNITFEPKEVFLVLGEIGHCAYADKYQHPRIQTVKKHVSILRQVYERTWDQTCRAQNERCIFAVCAASPFRGGWGHQKFVIDLFQKFNENGVSICKYGRYQKRLEIYNEIAPLHEEGLSRSFLAQSDYTSMETPASYQDKDEIYVSCARSRCWRYSVDELARCTRCKVVLYCSCECQEADWPNHKDHCKKLAKLRKDKEAIAELAQRF